MPDRCDNTDLLVAECAHCRDLPEPGREPGGRPVVTITAGYPGRCAGCGEPFPAGSTITADPDGHGWTAECCEEGPHHG